MNQMMRMRFLGDEPITKRESDQLGLSAFAHLIASSIEFTETPFVYGVLGDWGTGKTSTMHLLEEELRNSKSSKRRFVPIWFNAWLYENETNLVFPLLYAIRKAHEGLAANGDDSKFKSIFRVVTTTALAASDLALRAVTKKVFDTAYSIDDIKKNFELSEAELSRMEGVLSGWADKVTQIQSTFDNLIDTFAEDYASANGFSKDDVVFLIMIDDLDRCLPHTTLSILESIKNFLSVRKCVFILGLNPTVVYAGIQHKFLGVAVNGREYLEKILNYSFYVPEPDAADVQKFATSRLTNLIDDDDVKKELGKSLEAFGRVLSACKYSNPRKIKRVLNRYLLFLARYKEKLELYEIDNVVKLIIQAEYYPDLFQVFLSDAGHIDLLKKIGTKEFDLGAFQLQTGVSISNDYPHLTRIRELFNVSNPLDPKANLQEHANAVFAIARLK